MSCPEETQNFNGGSVVGSPIECTVTCSTPLPLDARTSSSSSSGLPKSGVDPRPGLLTPPARESSSRRLGGSKSGLRRRGAVSEEELNRVPPNEHNGVALRKNIERSPGKNRISLSSSESDIVSLSLKQNSITATSQNTTWFSRSSSKKKRSAGSLKRVSCKDVGGGDCEGWLWKKNDKKVALARNRWILCWVIIHNRKLYCFKDKEDHNTAMDTMHLPGFKVSPAPEIRTKPFAFKVHHTGTTFYFAAERQDDMAKWMNKMGLATLENIKLDDLATPGIHSAEKEIGSLLYFDVSHEDNDDSEDDEDRSSGGTSVRSGNSSRYASNKSLSSITSDRSREDITDLYLGLVKSEVDINGVDLREKRSTVYRNETLRSVSQIDPERARCRKLLSLQRTLKDKEQCLADIEDFLTSQRITSQLLKQFTNQHPDLIGWDGDQTPLAEQTSEGWTPNWNQQIEWKHSSIGSQPGMFV